MRADLERVRAWADGKLATGDEPPWAWYQYMKLRETLDAILSGLDAVMPLPEGSQALEPHPASGPRLVVCNDRPGTALRHPSDAPVQMPM